MCYCDQSLYQKLLQRNNLKDDHQWVSSWSSTPQNGYTQNIHSGYSAGLTNSFQNSFQKNQQEVFSEFQVVRDSQVMFQILSIEF